MLYPHVQKIGLLPGGTYSMATAINNLGEVTGWADISNVYFPGQLDRAIFWSPSAGLQRLKMIPVEPYDNGSAQGAGINDQSQIVGTYAYALNNPFIWSRDTGMQPLEQELDNSDANAVNERGQIAGDLVYTSFGGTIAVAWEPGQPFKVINDSPDVYSSVATAINDQGTIAGYQTLVSQQESAFVAHPGGSLQSLTIPGAPPSRAKGISNGGQVVGSIGNRGFVWTEQTGMNDIGTLGGTDCVANGVNTAGSIVGSSTLPDGERRAFRYDNGVMLDLQTLLPANTSWVLQEAVAINEKGQIAGNGLLNGVRMGFVLSSPELYTVRDIRRQVMLTVSNIIHHRGDWLWPFGWPFPDPDPGPVPWKGLYPQGVEPLILAALYTLSAELSDEKLRSHLQDTLLPLLDTALRRLEK